MNTDPGSSFCHKLYDKNSVMVDVNFFIDTYCKIEPVPTKAWYNKSRELFPAKYQ
jgi:hypothetical protein